jgi:ATP-dependent protease HslVU (ClpYQ) peptidase subunit
MANYSFKTVMVSDEDRSAFTALREKASKFAGAKISDKDLFGVIFDNVNQESVMGVLRALVEIRKENREKAKLEKLQAKVAAKLTAIRNRTDDEGDDELAAQTV